MYIESWLFVNNTCCFFRGFCEISSKAVLIKILWKKKDQLGSEKKNPKIDKMPLFKLVN